MSSSKYQDIIVEVVGRIGIIKFNRPKTLNAFGGKLMVETIAALRELNEHPDTVFTVLTGEGRFFSAGADVKSKGGPGPIAQKGAKNADMIMRRCAGDTFVGTGTWANDAEKKLAYVSIFSSGMEFELSLFPPFPFLIVWFQ